MARYGRISGEALAELVTVPPPRLSNRSSLPLVPPPPAGGGYSGWRVPGCLCPVCSMIPYGYNSPTPGITGFSELGEENFAPGSVTGYRKWALPAPDLSKYPLDADDHWPRSPLSGSRAPWNPGINEAVCLAGPGAHEEPLPSVRCGCGYWAYWKLSSHQLDASGLPVAGVIEGWGRTRIGELGFRCAEAKILALAPSFSIRSAAAYYPGGWHDAFSAARPQLPPAEQAWCEDWCEAWMSVIECRLEELQPGARLFTDERKMLAAFPLDPAYASSPDGL